MAVGVGLRIWAYAAEPSLWLDEILLARNILNLPLGHLLTQPLYLDQVAPRGFLLVEKLVVTAFGPGELALRLFPFLCGIAGLLLFRRLAERALDGWAVPFAVGLCALGVPFIRYSAEVKQYSADAAGATLLMVIAMELWRRDASLRRLLAAGGAGLAISWFSHASVLTMTGIGVAFAAHWLLARDSRSGRVLAVTMPVWALAAAIAVYVGRQSMNPATEAFMEDFWRRGFLPLPFQPSTALSWLYDSALSALTDPTLVRYRWPPLFLAAAAMGMLWLWRERREVALLIAGPLVVGLGAAIAQEYPFRGRLLFYQVPGLLLAIAAGAEWIRRLAARRHPALGGALMAALAVPPVLALAKASPPYDIESTRTLLAYLQRHRRAGDAIHAFPLFRVGLLYYGPGYGLRPDEWRSAACERDDTRAYLRDVDRYRGVSRLWLLSSTPQPYRTARPAVQAYLGTIGVKLDSLEVRSLQFQSVSLELYDLNDSTRLATADAEHFPVLPMPTAPKPGCRPWIRPSPADRFP